MRSLYASSMKTLAKVRDLDRDRKKETIIDPLAQLKIAC